MKRFLLALLSAVALVSVASAQTTNSQALVDRPILNRFDLDTPTITATTNYIVTSTNVVNSTYTIANQPDTPRNITGTVTDTTPSVVGGTITIAGTDVNDAAQTEVWTLTSLTFTGSKIFKTVTSITGASITVLGGAGDETVVMGVGSVTSFIYCSLGDPVVANGRIKTSGSSTTVTAVTGLGYDTPFSQIAVGDEITATGVTGQNRRVVTAKASGASITVFSAVDLSGNGASTGYQWQYRTLTCGYSDTAGWVTLQPGEKSIGIVVRQATNTGGVSYQLEGNMRGGSGGAPIKLTSGTFSSALVTGLPDNTSGNVFAIADAVSRVRIGLKFATTDDASDAGTEAIDAYLTYEAR